MSTTLNAGDPIVVEEGGTFLYEWDLVDETGAAVAAADLDAGFPRVTLYEPISDTIINSRNAQNIQNTNDGTYHATNGHGTLTLGPDDNGIIGSTTPVGKYEEHVMLIEVEWNTGAGSKRWQRIIRVLNLGHVS